MNAIQRTHARKPMRIACCGLQPALCEPAARRPHGFSCVCTRGRVHNTYTKWSCWEFHCTISGNEEKVEICSTRCGMRHAASGKVWTCLKKSGAKPLKAREFCWLNQMNFLFLFILILLFNFILVLKIFILVLCCFVTRYQFSPYSLVIVSCHHHGVRHGFKIWGGGGQSVKINKNVL